MITIKIVPAQSVVNVVSVDCEYAISKTYAKMIQVFAASVKAEFEQASKLPVAVLLNGEPVAVEDFARFAMRTPEPHPYAVELEERDNLR